MVLSRSAPRHLAAILAAFSLHAFPARAVAEGEDQPSAAPPAAVDPAKAATREGRELAGHVFMPALGLVMPFATTSFGTYLTIGEGTTKGSVTLTLPDGRDQTFTGTVSYAGIGGVVAYEAQLWRGLSARFKFSETLYSGITGPAVAVVGTNVRIGTGLGLTAGLPLGDSVRVAAILDASIAPRMGLLLGPAIKDALASCRPDLANCEFDFSKLFEQHNVLHLEPGVSASWAPLRALGVTGNLTYARDSIRSSGSGTSSEAGISAGAAADFDLLGISSVPVGLQVTWGSMFPIEGGDNLRYTDLGGGLFYTGRKDLSLGLQFIVRRFKVAPAVDVSWSTVLATIGLRYYW